MDEICKKCEHAKYCPDKENIEIVKWCKKELEKKQPDGSNI
jgi:hypothetical protein